MDMTTNPDATGQTATEALGNSFDLATRQDATDAVVTTLQYDVDEVKARLDRVSRAAARPALDATQTSTDAQAKSFIDGYLRKGLTPELKSFSESVLSDGGYAVPRKIDTAIADVLLRMNPIRAISQVVQVGTAGYRKLITTGGTASGWVSETTARPMTSTP